jgi:hypothetical protein
MGEPFERPETAAATIGIDEVLKMRRKWSWLSKRQRSAVASLMVRFISEGLSVGPGMIDLGEPLLEARSRSTACRRCGTCSELLDR